MWIFRVFADSPLSCVRGAKARAEVSGRSCRVGSVPTWSGHVGTGEDHPCGPAALKQAVAELRAEVATLKGVKGQPKLKPSGMDKATGPEPAEKSRGSKARKVGRLTIHEDRVITADVPVGSRFKGYEDFLVQDLMLRPPVIRLRRERWLTPDGRTVVAPMPAGIVGHFGPELRRFVLFQYHQGQVTVPRLVAQLRAIGITISKRQVVRLLNEGQGTFLDEAREVLRAGLSAASWISVDDTGARPSTGTASAPSRGPQPAMGRSGVGSSATTTSPRSSRRPRRAG